MKLRLCQDILVCLLISFLGWSVETLLCSLRDGAFCDRGFLNLPFCTIYGFSVLAIDALIGTPQEGGLLLRHCRPRRLRLLAYFLLAALIPTLAELATGAFFFRRFGLRLWDYSALRYNFRGYVCLEFSLLWGVLITAGMAWLYPRIRKAVSKIPRHLAGVMAIALALAVCIDWAFCFALVRI